MTIRTSLLTLERGDGASLDPATGEFPMTLASDAEATDGDLLSIEGAQFPPRVPLQCSHVNDPRSTLGSVSGFRRDLSSRPKRLRARGQIELGGDGALAEIRRDLALMVARGHVTGISVRWEPIKFTRRSELPRTHSAYPHGDNPRRRSGVWHESWRVLEGSLVAVQADRASVVGRAAETEGALRQFWRSMAENACELPMRSDLAHALDAMAALEARLDALERQDVVQPAAPRDLIAEAEARAAQTVADLRAHMKWHSGAVLDATELEAARRMREKLDAIRKQKRFALPDDFPPAA
jgi:hypothetical protein